jgi:hypothetical protein
VTTHVLPPSLHPPPPQASPNYEPGLRHLPPARPESRKWDSAIAATDSTAARMLLHNFRTKGIDRDRLCGLMRPPLACRMYQVHGDRSEYDDGLPAKKTHVRWVRKNLRSSLGANNSPAERPDEPLEQVEQDTPSTSDYDAVSTFGERLEVVTGGNWCK